MKLPLNDWLVPSPKFQVHELRMLELMAVNWTVSGAFPESGLPVKSAPGLDVGVTVAVSVDVGVMRVGVPV